MLFNSSTFLIFFLILLALSFIVPKSWIKPLLLVASLIFYAWWYPPYLLMLFVLVYIDFYCCKSIERARPGKFYLLFSVILHLLILFGFKYLHFFLGIFGYSLPENFKWSLPLGISFITFHTLSCTIDVYRGQHRAPEKYSDLLYYVCFFPHLIAGPILRLKDHWENIVHPAKPSMVTLNSGLYLIFWGLCKKMLIADNLGSFVERCFDHPETLVSPGIAWLGVYAFAVQIYCDFSGYIDTALGIAKIFAVKLPDNFNYPYFARSITEFWRRWHITLSEWLRDYLYIPLGGNRHGSLMTYRNLMLTMLLGGLWHGASWTFVVWGFLHGLYLSLEKYFARGKQDKPQGIFSNLWKYLLCFHAVCLAWVFFRAKNFSLAFNYIASMFGCVTASVEQQLVDPEIYRIVFVILLSLVLHGVNYRYDLKNKVSGLRLEYRLAYLVLMVALIALFGVKQEARFIYFDF